MPKIYKLDEREIHTIGDFVAVCWNMKRTKNKIIQDGVTYSALVSSRDGEPYIDFVMINDRHDEPFEDEDSPVDGGFSADEAMKIAAELVEAVEYLRALTKQGSAPARL